MTTTLQVTRPRTTIGATGRWRVSTATSTYVVDLDAGTATRTPRTVRVPAIRGDREPVRLRSVALAALGQPLVLVLERSSGSLTLRRSTPVREIVRIDGPVAAPGR
ncbi:hypothetical protein [Nocardioides caldifontis]|uniref:hypothetical protein n=1 Tax=Nocardioides caldifontis TaxID=2588938 RepID=UPI0011E02595|nr:hypothetical protein [Nocardioides caldifontis]